MKEVLNILTRRMNLMSLIGKFARFQNKDYCLKAGQFVKEKQYSFHGFFEDLLGDSQANYLNLVEVKSHTIIIQFAVGRDFDWG